MRCGPKISVTDGNDHLSALKGLHQLQQIGLGIARDRHLSRV